MTEPPTAPILAHLQELRFRLVKGSVAVLVGSVVAWIFRGPLFNVLVAPYERSAVRLGFETTELNIFGVTEGFSIAMRLALFGGVIIASPVLFYQAWAFVNPALSKRERRWAIPIVLALVSLFLLGVGFAYWSMERALEFLLGIQKGVETLISVDNYFRFTTRFLLVFGIAFQFPVFLFAAAAAGLVSARQLAQNRRWAVLVIVVIGAVVTPTGDPLTLLLLSVPLYLFYETTIWLVRWILRK